MVFTMDFDRFQAVTPASVAFLVNLFVSVLIKARLCVAPQGKYAKSFLNIILQPLPVIPEIR